MVQFRSVIAQAPDRVLETFIFELSQPDVSDVWKVELVRSMAEALFFSCAQAGGDCVCIVYRQHSTGSVPATDSLGQRRDCDMLLSPRHRVVW